MALHVTRLCNKIMIIATLTAPFVILNTRPKNCIRYWDFATAKSIKSQITIHTHFEELQTAVANWTPLRTELDQNCSIRFLGAFGYGIRKITRARDSCELKI